MVYVNLDANSLLFLGYLSLVILLSRFYILTAIWYLFTTFFSALWYFWASNFYSDQWSASCLPTHSPQGALGSPPQEDSWHFSLLDFMISLIAPSWSTGLHNIFIWRSTGYHMQTKRFELKFFIKNAFLAVVKSSFQLVNFLGTQLLMKSLKECIVFT